MTQTALFYARYTYLVFLQYPETGIVFISSPLVYFITDNNFLRVAGPYTPSAFNPFTDWNLLTASAVSGPYTLSTPLFFAPLLG